MENFDLVDENDQVVGITNHDESHKKGLLHRVIAVFVFDHYGKLLVQIREEDGEWDHSVGGHVSQGESYDQAVIREIYEELLLSGTPTFLSKVVADERFTGKKVQHMFGLYEYHLKRNWKFKPTEEVKKIKFMKIEEIVEGMNISPAKFTGGFLYTMNEYLKVKKFSFKLSIKKLTESYTKIKC